MPRSSTVQKATVSSSPSAYSRIAVLVVEPGDLDARLAGVVRPVENPDQPPDHLLRAVDRPQGRPLDPAAIGDEDDVGGQQGHERIHVPGRQVLDELVQNGVVPFPVDDLRTSRVDVAPGAVGQLPHRCLGPVQGRGHLGEAEPEDVVQHERGPLQRRQRLEHDEHGHRHRVGQLDALGGTTVGRHRFGQPRPDVVLSPALLLANAVQRLPGRDGQQVGPRVAHLAPVGRRPAQPGLLHRILRVGDTPEHPVGGTDQLRSQLLELPGQREVRLVVGLSHATAAGRTAP